MKNLHKKLRFLSLFVVAGLLILGAALPTKAYIQKAGTVNEAVTLRQNADSGSNQVLELTTGQTVKVNNELTGEDGNTWYQLIVNENTLGYVPASTITVSGNVTTSQTTTPSQGQTTQTTQTVTITERIGTVTASTAIRVRQEATTASEHIASMLSGDKFLVLDETQPGDGYTWYKAEFDDQGTTVVGYVRSDLVSVEEVTRQEQQVVDTPVTPPSKEPTQESPYSIVTQVNAEGTRVWYLVDDTTGDAQEISSLLAGADKQSGRKGAPIFLVVLLLILVLAAAGVAVFFYMRWREAEEFIDELREQQIRAKKQPTANRGTQTKQAPQTKQSAKNEGVASSLPKFNLPSADSLNKMFAKEPKAAEQSKAAVTEPAKASKPVQQPESKPVAKAAEPVKSTKLAEPVKPAAKPTEPVKTTKPTEPVKTTKPTEPAKSTSEVLPHTADIVNATKRELNNKQAASSKSGAWKSKNFLTDDDDLEFDFLDMEDL